MTTLAAQMRARRPPGRHKSCMSRAIFRPPFMHIQEAVRATRQSYWHLHRPHLESLVRHLLKSILRTSEGFVQSIYTEIQGECKNFKGSPLNARSSKMVRRALFAGVAIFFLMQFHNLPFSRALQRESTVLKVISIAALSTSISFVSDSLTQITASCMAQASERLV